MMTTVSKCVMFLEWKNDSVNIFIYIKKKIYDIITYSELDKMVMFNSMANDEVQQNINHIREEFVRQQKEVDNLMGKYETKITLMNILMVVDVVALVAVAIKMV